MGRLLKNLLIYVVIVVFAVLVIKMLMPPANNTLTWDYNTFLTSLSEGKIAKISLKSSGDGTSYHVDTGTAG